MYVSKIIYIHVRVCVCINISFFSNVFPLFIIFIYLRVLKLFELMNS